MVQEFISYSKLDKREGMPEGRCNIIRRVAEKQNKEYEFHLVYGRMKCACVCECASYLGGHNSVITELGWDESFSGRTLLMTNIDSPAVYSSLITSKLEEEAVERGRDKKTKREREDMTLVILDTEQSQMIQTHKK